MTQQEVIIDTLGRLELKLQKESKAYGVTTIILSVLDVLCGIICIICTSIQITSVVVSILSGTVVCTRAVQILKTRNLLNTIKVLNGLATGYVVCRMKKGEYMKNFVKCIKNNPLTLLFAILGGLTMGFSGYKISQSYFVAPNYAYILVGVGCAALTVLFVVILGWDKAKSAILRTAKKTLTKENYDLLVGTVGELEKKQAEEAEKKAQEEAHQKEVDNAKAVVGAYEKAKKILDEDAQKQAEIAQENTENTVE